MNEGLPEYGLWWVVAINSLIFITFAFSFFRPRSPRDWRSFGAFSAFLVALFTEMYGFPLTIYLFSGWLSSLYPGIDWFAHDSGHLLEMMFGWGGDPHVGPFHLLSSIFVIGGFILLAAAWRVLYRAQRERTLAMTGPYALVRHPQYLAFISIMFGFLLQWPTLPTLVIFPILVFMYVRLARHEEEDAFAEFGEEYLRYRNDTPAWRPHVGSASQLGAVILLIAVFLAGMAITSLVEPDLPAKATPRGGRDGVHAGTLMRGDSVRQSGQRDAPGAWNQREKEASDAAWRQSLIRAHFEAVYWIRGYGRVSEMSGSQRQALSLKVSRWKRA